MASASSFQGPYVLLPWRKRVRTRLFAAFAVLFVLTLAVVVVGVQGMRSNLRTIDEFEASVMPEIARVLELAEKVAQLAAVAASLGDDEAAASGENDDETMRSLLAEIRRLSAELPSRLDERLEASTILDGIDRDLAKQLVLSSERQVLQRRLLHQRRMIEDVESVFSQDRGRIQRVGAALRGVWAAQVAATLAGDAAALGLAESNAEALWVSAQAQGELQRAPDVAARLMEISSREAGVFQTRRELLSIESRIRTAIQLTRSNANRLGVRASGIVVELREVAANRRDAVRSTVRSGVSSVFLLACVFIGVALMAVAYVHRILRRLQSVTYVMSRLASGDTTQATPATERTDEIGDLARAFQVFRENLLAKQRLTLRLDAQRRLLEAVFQSMNDGFSVYDAQGKLVTWNTKFPLLLGLPDGVIRSGIDLKALRRALPRGIVWRGVAGETVARPGHLRIATSAELHFPDGRVLEFESYAMPDGGWVSSCRDSTVKRVAEAQLQQAQRLEVLGQLTGGVAHDFNNFLSAILGNLELLLRRLPDDSETKLFAGRANRAAERAAGLTRRLLAFARRQTLAPEIVPPSAMLAEMLDLIEFSVGLQVKVRVESAGTQALVRVDRGQLENAVLNLALNSAAAMPHGGVLSLAVRSAEHSERVVPPGPAVVLQVSDTGHGIPAAIRAKVVEPFFSTKGPAQGSGLGLSIIYGFVRQSGGDLVIASEENLGTTVELWLPAVSADQDAPLQVALPVAPSSHRRRVLLVEDDADVRATASAAFAELSSVVLAVSGEAEALAAIAQDGPFDLVLSDVMLGDGGDGIVLARKIRERWPALRVVLASGLSIDHYADRPDWQADQAFIAKPFSLAALALLLE